MSTPPDGLTLARDRDLAGRDRRPVARRVIVGLLVAFVLLALLNLFGQRPSTTTGTIALMTMVVSFASFKLPFIRPVLDGEPVIVVEDGNPIERNLARNRITLGELQAAARIEGIASISDVRWAVLETSGQISFIPKS